MSNGQRGVAPGKWALVVLVLVTLLGIATATYWQLGGADLRQQAMIQAASMAGDVAAGVMDRADSQRANQLHNVPVTIEKINDFIYQARGIGNTHVITTSHGHADHIGGIKFWKQPETRIIAHAAFAEEQRYLSELEPYFWNRNRLLFPFMPEKPPQGGMQRMRDAVHYVHDATVAGMNAGRSMGQLMDEVKLPARLQLTQGHGKVSWAVKSLWEYYSTWFHFESTTELYSTPARAVYADLGELAGVDALVSRALDYRNRKQCVHALHLLEMALAQVPDNRAALSGQQACLEALLEDARVLNNTYEVMWLESRIADTQAMLDG